MAPENGILVFFFVHFSPTGATHEKCENREKIRSRAHEKMNCFDQTENERKVFLVTRLKTQEKITNQSEM